MSAETTGSGTLSAQRALNVIRTLRAELEEAKSGRFDPIAIVGVSLRLPGACDSLEGFWSLLDTGSDGVGPMPSDRWDHERFFDPEGRRPGSYFVDRGGFLPDVDRFDPEFFGIAPTEARTIDPQQRLLLECTVEALEHAGIPTSSLAGVSGGVFVGIGGQDYHRLAMNDPEAITEYTSSGSALSVASGRISYLLGLTGPAFSVDTACSSSLVAVHLACASLRSGESEVALAAGVNVILGPELTINFCRAGMLARDGRCKTFDASADGYVRSEGCGVVVLKRLSDAEASGDRILGVIRGTAVNQDGASSGLTAPNGPAQEAVIRSALRDAGLAPETIGYVEAHGTGTSLGDPIEVQALGAVFGEGRDPARPLRIGSVKTNLGHLEAAAGITGLIKAVETVRRGTIPAHLHFTTPSPHIPWDRLPVEVPTESVPFDGHGEPRRAGVSSFGFSGTNAHVIVEEPPRRPEPKPVSRPLHVLTLSAPEEAPLREVVERYRTVLDAAGDAGAATRGARFADVCHTAGAGRAHASHRIAVVAGTAEEAAEKLRGWEAEGQESPGVRGGVRGGVRSGRSSGLWSGRVTATERPGVAFLYTGQGSQYAGMGWALYESAPTFRAAIDRCGEILEGELDRPLTELLRPWEGEGPTLLDRTEYQQPALFALQYALGELWSEWGVRPDVVVGHSVGEYAAAERAGVFTLEDALRVVTARGRLMGSGESGGMVALRADEARVQGWLERVAGVERVSIAAVNAPEQVVVSGPSEGVDRIGAHAEAEGVKATRLETSAAFHSELMDEAVEGMREVVSGVELKAGRRVRMVSTVTGRAIEPETLADPEYWATQIRRPVRFADATHAVVARSVGLGIELGPQPVLAALAVDCGVSVPVLPTLRKGVSPWETLTASVARSYVSGVEVDWAGFDRSFDLTPAQLPTYPFQREPLWVELGERGHRRVDSSTRSEGAHPILGSRLDRPGEGVEFRSVLSMESPAFIGEHRVGGRALVPGAALLEAAIHAGHAAFAASDSHSLDLCHLELLAAVDCSEGARVLHTRVDPEGRVEIHSRFADERSEASEWILHVRGELRPGAPIDDPRVDSDADFDVEADFPPSSGSDVDAFYERLRSRGYDFGPRLQGLRSFETIEGMAFGRIRLPSSERDSTKEYGLHPLLLDAALQLVGALLPDEETETFVPVSFERVSLSRLRTIPSVQELTVRARLVRSGATGLVADLVVLDTEVGESGGRVVGTIEGIAFRAFASGSFASGGVGPDSRNGGPELYEVRWIEGEGDADPTGTPMSAESLVGLLRRSVVDVDLERYDREVAALETRSIEFMRAAFRELGWNRAVGDRFDLSDAMRSLSVVADRERLLARILEALTEEGWLEFDGTRWTVLRDPRSENPEPVTPVSPEFHLLERAGPTLGAGLRGAIDPLEILFPGGDATLAGEMYFDAPPARAFNGSIAEWIVEAIRDRSSTAPLRVLEVGGGTCGTTRRIVEAVRESESWEHALLEYTFTDISPHFVHKAEERFGDLPGFAFRTFDLDRSPEDQGFEPGTFDVIVAANCVHASKDLSRALGHLRSLLSATGTLLAVEVFRPHRWFDLTVGLTDGWWHFEDDRVGYACVSVEEWRRRLADTGFGDVHTLTLDTVASGLGDRLGRGQGLVVAHAGSAPVRTGPVLVVSYADSNPERPEWRSRWSEDVQRIYGAGTTVHTLSLAEVREGRFRSVWVEEDRWAELVFDCTDRPTDSSSGRPELYEPLHALHSVLRTVRNTPAVEVGAISAVTRGAQFADPHDTEIDAVGAGLWGLLRSFRLEAPEIRVSLLDLDPHDRASDAERMPTWLRDPTRAPESAARFGRLRTPRLQVSRLRTNADRVGDEPVDAVLPVGAENVRLDLDPSRSSEDSFESLNFVGGDRRAPGPGEVEIRVAATALNFKDVLNTLGMVPGSAGPLGSECAGVVVRVGSGVEIPIGTRVMATVGGAYARYVVAPARFVAPIPTALGFADAATLPVAYLTAHFALSHRGRLGPDDRVLIHSAAGGVGSAACALARTVGATVFATAGTPEKREMLRERGFAYVYDSRTDAFAEEILRDTDGAGVTVVLNSLADERIDASFRAIARDGRFLEIGKRGIWSPERVEALGKNLDYHVIDWGETAAANPEEVGTLFAQVAEWASKGTIEPLPTRIYPFARAREAFRYMARGEHIGKVVLVHSAQTERPPLRFRSDGSYLISGGTGGIGRLTAEWAIESGAGAVVLLSRTGGDDEAIRAIDRLRASGATVEVVTTELGDLSSLLTALEGLNPDLPPVRGVVHGAGALRDGLIENLDRSDLDVVLDAKVAGAVHLHRALRDAPLDFFVSFSSVASVLGSPGQSNHAAACAALDALGRVDWWSERTEMTLGWGPWSEVGAAVREGTLRRALGLGFEGLRNDEGVALMERAWSRPSGHRIGMRIGDPSALNRHLRRTLLDAPSVSWTGPSRTGARPAFAGPDGNTGESPPARDLADRVRALPAGSRRAHLRSEIAERVGVVLGRVDGKAVDVDRPLGEFGLDSLLAVELRNILGTAVGTSLPTTLLFDYPTVEALTDYLYGVLFRDEEARGDVSSSDPSGRDGMEEIPSVDDLTDDDVNRILAEKWGQSDE